MGNSELIWGGIEKVKPSEEAKWKENKITIQRNMRTPMRMIGMFKNNKITSGKWGSKGVKNEKVEKHCT